MRFFPLEGFRDIILFLFPTLIFIILLYVGWSRAHFRTRDSEEREKRIYHSYPEGLQDRIAPFPLILVLIIVGYVLWAIFYMLGIAILGVKI
jgi:hypothetical protein